MNADDVATAGSDVFASTPIRKDHLMEHDIDAVEQSVHPSWY